ncbi:MAG: lysophospholipid acyltransferase family protein [Pyrinomonadaceae bacterium]
MNETETGVEAGVQVSVAGRRNGGGGSEAGSQPFVLPRWGIEILRVVFRATFRLLWNMRVRGEGHIPLEGGLIIAANHQTYIDPFWLAVPVRRYLRYLAWDEIFSWPLVGTLVRWLGAWPLQLERGDPQAIRRSLQWLRQGGAVVIFPEGGRAKADGVPRRFKTGAARMALEAGVPVLPVTIRGGHQIWPSDWRYPKLSGHLELIYHPLQHVSQLPGETPREAARRASERLAETIHSAL